MLLHEETTELIIKAYYDVFNKLGYGFLEKVYENALLIELREYNLEIVSQKSISVLYNRKKVGSYFADLMIENKVIVEVKACEKLREEHEAQLINYLKATNVEVGLLLNFDKYAEFKRKVFENKRK